MPTHPTAPDPSSDELKTRIANFMRRAEDVVNHPLAGHTPGITLKFTLDPRTNTATSATMDHNNIPIEGLVFLATRMRPYIFLKDDPISLES